MRLDASDVADLAPLIGAVVQSTIDRIEADRAKLGDRLGHTEAEAASLLGVQRHVLRDARLRGEISARKIGCRFVYSRASLVAFLAEGSGQ